MTAHRWITDVRLADASECDRGKGLFGYISCTFCGLMRVDGITLRKTLAGRWALSWPARTDRAGRQHPYVWPLDLLSRQRIENDIFKALGCDLAETGS